MEAERAAHEEKLALLAQQRESEEAAALRVEIDRMRLENDAIRARNDSAKKVFDSDCEVRRVNRRLHSLTIILLSLTVRLPRRRLCSTSWTRKFGASGPWAPSPPTCRRGQRTRR